MFVAPPSLEELEERLRARGTETEDTLARWRNLWVRHAMARRLAAAAEEMEYGEEDGNFDIIIVNDQLEDAYRSYVFCFSFSTNFFFSFSSSFSSSSPPSGSSVALSSPTSRRCGNTRRRWPPRRLEPAINCIQLNLSG